MELKRILVFTSIDEKRIEVRHFETPLINEPNIAKGKLQMNLIGPSFDLYIRRERIAIPEQFAKACKKPKVENADKKKWSKNIFSDAAGNRMGKVYLQQ